MAEQFADADEVDFCLQQVRGAAMARRVDAADLADAGGIASEVEAALAGFERAGINPSAAWASARRAIVERLRGRCDLG